MVPRTYADAVNLNGRSVVICRARAQSAALSAGIESLGATVIEIPVLAIESPDDGGAHLRDALSAQPPYDWLVITSANGVDAVARALSNGPETLAAQTRVAVVGTATASRLRKIGIDADLIPQHFVGEGLVEAFPVAPPRGGRALVAQAAGARDVVRLGLADKGWTVDAVIAYRSVAAIVDSPTLQRAVDADAICFTSASTVDHFVAAAGVANVPHNVVCIGPVTADAATACGLTVAAVADPHTIDGLLAALTQLEFV